MSCIKNDNGGWSGATVALVVATAAGPLGNVTAGVATGATVAPAAAPLGNVAAGVATGAVTVLGILATGATVVIGPAPIGNVVGPVAGIWPLGSAAAGATTGATSVSVGSDASGALAGSGISGSTSSRIRAAFAHRSDMASSKQQIIALRVLEKESFQERREDQIRFVGEESGV
ncbi:unnamed protein product [Ilex paraguariensis]|uniref:Uncharacterized protein n=1 Tax=Ilex paraguariensis TaxID=185542 RepID=A0ABC8UA80_9AQUA